MTEELKVANEQRDKFKKENEDLTSQYQMKMNQVKILEMELEEKMNALNEQDG